MGFAELQEKPGYQKFTALAYGLGAAVVIIGALFKIMHWPGASFFLTAGMVVEAFLFALSSFDKPHLEYHWENKWPELLDKHGVADSATDLAVAEKPEDKTLPQIQEVRQLVNTEMSKLTDGISKLNETAGQLNNLSSAAAVSEAYTKNLESASLAAGAFAASQSNLKASSDSLVASYQNIAESIGSASKGSQNFASQIDGINKNISTISSVFELQVKSVNEQNEAMKTLAAAVNKIEASLNGSAQSAESYKQEISNLAKQMHDLNKVYGNMLNAMTIRG